MLTEIIDWYFLLVTNPDGYEYTRSTNRNWRKGRSPVSLICFGSDLNRNFGYNWLIPDEIGNEGASRAPCSDTYAGSAPFSEPETDAMEDYFSRDENYRKFDVFLSLHSYAHQILFPLGNTGVRVVSFDKLNLN